MRPMRSFVVVALTVLLAPAAACSGKATDPVGELKGLKDKMCACTDAACAEKVDPAVTAWTTHHEKGAGARDDAKALLAGIALCRDGAVGDPLAREILAKLTEFRDRACACTDAACGEQVQLDQGKWLQDNQARFAPVKSTKAQEEAANAIGGETEKCVRKVTDGGAAPGSR